MHEHIVLLGGAFNPIGLHHVEMARRILLACNMPVWFMPCYRHRFSKDQELISPDHRRNMINAALEHGELKVCDWEISHQHTGSMWETMEGLTKQFPSVQFHIAIGMDNANNILQWDRAQQLIQRFPFVVVVRQGVSWSTDWFTMPPHLVIPFNVKASSSSIRRAIQEGRCDFAQKHLHPRVWEYIQKEKLYGCI